MKRIIGAFFCCISFTAYSQISEFNMPWADSTKAIIIDPYEGNSIDWQKLATNKQVVAVIHKASQGLKKDSQYAKRKQIAISKGLLWGSYHLGVSGDPIKQADFYLEQVQNDSTVLMALDIETLDKSKSMSLTNAEKFIEHIHSKTGRYPLLYCNNEVFEAINKRYTQESVFAKSGLWYARFRKNIPTFNIKIWPSYTLWQFSSEINCTKTGSCLFSVQGTNRDMDINVYNGSITKLRENWPFIIK